MRRRFGVGILAGLLLLAAACSEEAPEEDATGGSDVTTVTGDDVREGDTVVERFAGEEWFLGTMPDAPVAADPDAEPIVIGMINQEDTPLGSFPEVRRAVEGGVDFVNAELGGVDGHPLELHTCITSFDPEQSAACAQEMVAQDVVALVGGLDVTSNGSVPVLEDNGIPQLGGIPANLVEQQSDVTFFFSGGVTGGLAAFLAHTAEEGGTSSVLAYGEFESFEVVGPGLRRPRGRLPRHRSRGHLLSPDRHRLPAGAHPGGRVGPRLDHRGGGGLGVCADHDHLRRPRHRGPALPGRGLCGRGDHPGGGWGARRRDLQLGGPAR